MKDTLAYKINEKTLCLDCVVNHDYFPVCIDGTKVSHVESKDKCPKCGEEYSSTKSAKAVKIIGGLKR